MQTTNLKRSGILFILAGLTFFVAFALSRQVAFIGVGVAFLGIGAGRIAKARKSPKN